jgi:fatty-acid desaturase
MNLCLQATTLSQERKGQRNWQQEHGHFQWIVFVQIGVCHIGSLLAPWYFSWSSVFVALGLWFVSAGVGVCVGYHRLLTHRSFETHPFIRRILTFIATLAMQGGPSVWVGTHRLHHQFADKDGDPHSPKDDFWWGHMVWLYFFEHLDARSHAEDVMSDPWLRRLDQFWFMPAILLAVLLWWIGGLPFLVWGVFVRTVLVWHITWAVNSVAHRWGYRNYNTRDDSRNNFWVALLSFGEGWHNNHHAFPQSARHGLRRWEIDPAYLFIRLLERCGLAWKVRLP